MRIWNASSHPLWCSYLSSWKRAFNAGRQIIVISSKFSNFSFQHCHLKLAPCNSKEKGCAFLLSLSEELICSQIDTKKRCWPQKEQRESAQGVEARRTPQHGNCGKMPNLIRDGGNENPHRVWWPASSTSCILPTHQRGSGVHSQLNHGLPQHWVEFPAWELLCKAHCLTTSWLKVEWSSLPGKCCVKHIAWPPVDSRLSGVPCLEGIV